MQLNLMSLLLAWSVTEIIRYSFFAFKVRMMMTLRYSGDIVNCVACSCAMGLPHYKCYLSIP